MNASATAADRAAQRTHRAAPPRLAAIATALPEHHLEQEAVMREAAALFADAYQDIERFLPIFRNAAIGRRYSCVPLDWYGRPHGFAERNRLYIEHATGLAERAADEAIAQAGLKRGDIDTLVAVSTSGIATPSIDALLIQRMALRRDVTRLPIFGLGCAGGVSGLARAADLARARPGAVVLYVVVELCGLTFRVSDKSKSNLVATALFGDGAAACVLGTGFTGPALGAAGEHTFADSLDVMGWRVEDDGLGVLFSRDIPSLVRNEMAGVALEFLADQGLGFGDIDDFVCHPGGAKVLDALEEAYRLPPGGLAAARRVLREHGNMSSATVLFVLAESLRAEAARQAPARRRLLSSLGPGFTASFLLLEGQLGGAGA